MAVYGAGSSRRVYLVGHSGLVGRAILRALIRHGVKGACLPMARGLCYLTAIIDWASRRALSWRLSNTLDASFRVEALEEALARYGSPEIFNTDQDSQSTRRGLFELAA